MLYEFVQANRDEIIRNCRARVAARSDPLPTDLEIDHGVPAFLGQLIETLRLGLASDADIYRIAVKHGHDLQVRGFTIPQVVHGYGDVCQTITELAVTTGAPISTEDFRTLNGCLDTAIAGAVTEFGRQQNQSTSDREIAHGNERVGFLAHELRNLANTALLALEVLRTGNVGVSGNTGAILQRSLEGIRTLVGHSLDEVRLAHDDQESALLEPTVVSELIQQIEPAAAIAARSAGIRLTIVPGESDVAVEANWPILTAALDNLLQNAFKFTRPDTTVTLRVVASPERVLIEIEDECGGLPQGDVDQLFRAFEQRGADQTGLGLGLAFSRWAAESNNGRVHARNIPGQGCVFAIELPRLAVPATS